MQLSKQKSVIQHNVMGYTYERTKHFSTIPLREEESEDV